MSNDRFNVVLGSHKYKSAQQQEINVLNRSALIFSFGKINQRSRCDFVNEIGELQMTIDIEPLREVARQTEGCIKGGAFIALSKTIAVFCDKISDMTIDPATKYVAGAISESTTLTDTPETFGTYGEVGNYLRRQEYFSFLEMKNSGAALSTFLALTELLEAVANVEEFVVGPEEDRAIKAIRNNANIHSGRPINFKIDLQG